MKPTKMLMAAPLFFKILIFVMSMVLAIRSFEQSLQNPSFEFLVCICCLLQELLFIYLLCLFATNLTIKSTEMANTIYNTRWHALPLTQQKMITSIIRQGQIPFKLTGYIFSASLETFMKVRIESNVFFNNMNYSHCLIVDEIFNLILCYSAGA